MAFIDPWLEKGDMSPIDFERRMFEQTKNPMHVWNAVQICSELMFAAPRRIGDGYPDWVYQHLGAVSVRLRDLCFNRPEDAIDNFGAAIADALDLKKAGQGVRRDAFENRKIAWRDQGLASAVWHYLTDHPEASVREACTQLSEDSAQRALRSQAARNGSNTDRPWSEDAYFRAWQAWRQFFESAPWHE